MQSDKKTGLFIWASVAAAAAGITVAAVLFKCRTRICADSVESGTERRHLQQVLSDCYSKIQEIEAKLPAILSTAPTERTGHPSSAHRGRISNGTPILES